MIRRAELSDRMRVLSMAKAFHAASGVPFPFSPAMADGLFRASLADEDRLCLVYAPDDIARGVLTAQASVHPFAPVKVASEIIWWVDPAFRGQAVVGMLSAYEAWAVERGCSLAGMVGLGSEPLTTRLYLRRGYEPAETHFIKALNPRAD
jgi:GNAT superfamily N-acetyltransferase